MTDKQALLWEIEYYKYARTDRPEPISTPGLSAFWYFGTLAQLLGKEA